jgi:NADPH-dependent 2,4-dienoyl-CoA reductase/sulfur reductase-like enzyme
MKAGAQEMQKEVVVVGAGPAGLSAAFAAARAGVGVTLIDNYRQPGGQYFRQSSSPCYKKAISARARTCGRKYPAPVLSY